MYKNICCIFLYIHICVCMWNKHSWFSMYVIIWNQKFLGTGHLILNNWLIFSGEEYFSYSPYSLVACSLCVWLKPCELSLIHIIISVVLIQCMFRQPYRWDFIDVAFDICWCRNLTAYLLLFWIYQSLCPLSHNEPRALVSRVVCGYI